VSEELELKHGDRVTCCINGINVDDAIVSVNTQGTYYICQDVIRSTFRDMDTKFGYKYGHYVGKYPFISYYKVTSLKVINKTTTQTEGNMNKVIANLFSKTKDALLVEKYLGGDIPNNPVSEINLRAHADEILKKEEKSKD
jgi:hypothetical protein